MSDQINLQKEQADLLSALVEAVHNELRKGGLGFKVHLPAIQGRPCAIFHLGLPKGKIEAYIGDIDILSNGGLIAISSRSGNTLLFTITPEGFKYYDSMKQRFVEPIEAVEFSGNVNLKDGLVYNVFICHASEDKEDFVRPLAHELTEKGLRVWYDEFALTLGDSLLRKIDEGLRRSRYGVVVLSPAFFVKDWPRKELDGLASKEVGGSKVILPVWHNVTREDVQHYSPILAGLVAAPTSRGLPYVVSEILKVVTSSSSPPESQDISIVPKGSNLLIQKKHNVISRLYELFKVAEGAICGLYGLKWAPTFKEFNRDDIAKYMTQKELLSGIQQTILDLWDSDREAAISELGKSLIVRDKQFAKSSLTEVSNYLLINELYLSTEAANIAHRLVEKLNEYNVLVEFPPDRVKEFRDIEKEIKQGLEELMTQLKKDISNL